MPPGTELKFGSPQLGNEHSEITVGNPFIDKDMNPFHSPLGEKSQLDMVVDVSTFVDMPEINGSFRTRQISESVFFKNN